MAKPIRDHSIPSVANVPVGPAVNTGTENFELRPGLIKMVQANLFYGLPSEDANAHLQHFLEISDTFVHKDVAPDAIRLHLFPFSISGKAKQWFYNEKEAVSTWDKCSTAFLTKFFPMSKTHTLRGRIANFQQNSMEPIPAAWERLEEYIQACPHHGMEKWLVIQNFYNGLTPMSKEHIDATAGGAFLSLTIDRATALMEKIVSNQAWGEESFGKQEDNMQAVEETDIPAKMDLLLKELDKYATKEEEPHGTVKAIDSHVTCEVCGNVGHSGNDCPETREDITHINNGFRQQGDHSGWNNQSRPQNQGGNSNSRYNSNSLSLEDLVLDQAKIIEDLSKKLLLNDKTIENMIFKINSLTSSYERQLSFNKKVETQLAQFAAALPVASSRKVSGQPETSLEFVEMVSTRSGKPLCRKNSKSQLIIKKEDPGRPTITCSIGPHVFEDAFCDLGSSINIMSKVTYDEILGGPLSPVHFELQMADLSLKKPEGIAEKVMVKIREASIPTDFIILDMGRQERAPPILGRPFLNTTNAVLHVGFGHVSFHVQGQTMRCPFNGFNKHKKAKYKQPKKVKPQSVKQAWQAEKATSASTSPDTDAHPSSTK